MVANQPQQYVNDLSMTIPVDRIIQQSGILFTRLVARATMLGCLPSSFGGEVSEKVGPHGLRDLLDGVVEAERKVDEEGKV